jgi:hypothetical protein
LTQLPRAVGHLPGWHLGLQGFQGDCWARSELANWGVTIERHGKWRGIYSALKPLPTLFVLLLYFDHPNHLESSKC